MEPPPQTSSSAAAVRPSNSFMFLLSLSEPQVDHPVLQPPVSPTTGIPMSHHPLPSLTNPFRHTDDTFSDSTMMDWRDSVGSDIERHLDSMTLSARVRSCDVFISLSTRKPLLLRFVKWLRAELEMNGIACFVSDRRLCGDAHALDLAQRAMDGAAFDMVILSRSSFSNPYAIEEMRVFSERRKLVPVFFGIPRVECNVADIIGRRGSLWERSGGELWLSYGGLKDEWSRAVAGLSRVDLQFEANSNNFRNCIFEAVSLLGSRLGRTIVMENVRRWRGQHGEEFSYPRNMNFIGRKKEMLEIELILFGGVEGHPTDESTELRTRHSTVSVLSGGNGMARSVEEKRRKGKATVVSNEPEDGIEGYRSTKESEGAKHGWKGEGIACVIGDSGIGKTELILEFAYKYSQRYKKVLWIGGESRYLRHNFMKLLTLLGVDVSIENQVCPEMIGRRSHEEREEEAVLMVHKELMRDIPFLFVIDNLESEKDWWNGKSIMELLPQRGRETHVILSTPLPRITNIEPIKLLSFSHAEAMLLMKGERREFDSEETNALRIIGEKLHWLPLGLSIVRAVLSEHNTINPSKLLKMMSITPDKQLAHGNIEDFLVNRNPHLFLLLDVCFSVFDLAEKPRKLAEGMVKASGWFGPAPIPITMLALAAHERSKHHHSGGVLSKYGRKLLCMSKDPNAENSTVAEASSMLLRSQIARNGTKEGYMYFPDIIKHYGFKLGNGGDSLPIVQAIIDNASVSEHSDHIWAACYLVFKFGKDNVEVSLTDTDMVSFIKKAVVPLALHSYSSLSRCTIAMELLRLSSVALDTIKDSSLPKLRGSQKISSDSSLFQDLEKLRASILETRARLMLQGGQYDLAEEYCKQAKSIKEVVYGFDHSETRASHELLERILRCKGFDTFGSL